MGLIRLFNLRYSNYFKFTIHLNTSLDSGIADDLISNIMINFLGGSG